MSNSVVMMPTKPKYVTWLMEDKLVPFLHYVPIKADLSNVADMVRWCESHPEETLKIARHSTLYIYDIYFHLHSDDDQMRIKYGIMKKYKEQFGWYV